MGSQRLDHCLENMCQKGCKALWTDISDLEKGLIPEETKALSEMERRMLLVELKSIMSVYATSCSPEPAIKKSHSL